jgi:hypothetical protein
MRVNGFQAFRNSAFASCNIDFSCHAISFEPFVSFFWVLRVASMARRILTREGLSRGYAPKSLHWKKPAPPIHNVFDELPSGKFSEPKSMELHAIAGPPPPAANVVTDLPLDY